MRKTLTEKAREKANQLMASYGYSPALNAEVASLLRELASALEGAEREKKGYMRQIGGYLNEDLLHD